LNKTVIIVVVSLASSILLIILAWRFYARNGRNGTTHVLAQGSSLSNQPDVPQHYQQPTPIVANNMQTSVGVVPLNDLNDFNAPKLFLPPLPGETRQSSDETPSAGFNSDETPSSKNC
jgi:hypothetical protein